MGMFDHIEAECPTPGCKGRLYGQIKGGSESSYDVPHDGMMPAHEARDVDGTVVTEEIPMVRVQIVQTKKGDMSKTTPVENFFMKVYTQEQWDETFGHLKARFERPTREEYVAHMRRAEIEGDGLRSFHYVGEDGLHYEGSFYWSFKENK
jgi:hypothetical protein